MRGCGHDRRRLSTGEWAVLGVIAEGPTHGFALAQLLAPNGPLGRIWSLPRPIVYQAIKKLLLLGLISEQATGPAAGDPNEPSGDDGKRSPGRGTGSASRSNTCGRSVRCCC